VLTQSSWRHGAWPAARAFASWYDLSDSMRRPAILNSRSAFWVAAGASALVHLGIVALSISWFARIDAFAQTRANSPDGPRAAWRSLAVVPSEEVAPWEVATEIAMVAESVVLPERWQARHTGDDQASMLESSPRIANGLDPRPAAPDQGEALGMPSQDAWRRDQQTLRAQLTDGSSSNRAARTLVSHTVASSQAERRERSTGIGDVPKTAREALGLTTEVASEVNEAEEKINLGRKTALKERPGPLAQTGQGPLDAKSGSRRFDTETVGTASDVVDQRSASNEQNPGPIDLSVAGSALNTIEAAHRGPAETSGAVDQRSNGAASSPYGAREAVPFGAKVVLSAKEAARARYERAIRERALSMLKFPKKLALELQQGETILRFAVGKDGMVSGSVDVTKSAGFREFDEEAASAVKRASPFPSMPEALEVNMRFVFENPVLR
jgi:TonB family protein